MLYGLVLENLSSQAAFPPFLLVVTTLLFAPYMHTYVQPPVNFAMLAKGLVLNEDSE
jgi:hypothetical protein